MQAPELNVIPESRRNTQQQKRPTGSLSVGNINQRPDTPSDKDNKVNQSMYNPRLNQSMAGGSVMNRTVISNPKLDGSIMLSKKANVKE